MNRLALQSVLPKVPQIRTQIFATSNITKRAMSASTSLRGPLAPVKALDHVVLTVKDIDATTKFYSEVLGMRHETFAAATDPSVQRHALVFGQQKINLHKSGQEFEPKAGRVQPGSADVCFLTDSPVDDVLANLKSAGIEILEGGQVVGRTGAVGNLRSVYFRDPDQNLIEYAYETSSSERGGATGG